MVSPRALSASTTLVVPSCASPSSSEVINKAMLPECSGCSATKRSQAVTKAAILVFMSAVPRPYSLPSRSVGSNGGDVHFSSGPLGTTSVWPAKHSKGALLPRRAQMFWVSLKFMASMVKPIFCKRSARMAWQFLSSGVTEASAMSCLVRAKVAVSLIFGLLWVKTVIRYRQISPVSHRTRFHKQWFRRFGRLRSHSRCRPIILPQHRALRANRLTQSSSYPSKRGR